jgi:hypothetical protein
MAVKMPFIMATQQISPFVGSRREEPPVTLALGRFAAAKAIGVSPATLDRYAKRKLIDCIKPGGGRVLFPISALQKFLGAKG